MFGQKTKRIKELEALLEAKRDAFATLLKKYDSIQNENSNLRLHNGRLMNEVGRLQTQVQRLGLERNAKGQMQSLRK